MLGAAKTIRLICEVWLPVLPLLSACFTLKRHRYALVLGGERCDWVMLFLCYETAKRAAGEKELFERGLNELCCSVVLITQICSPMANSYGCL